MDRAALLLALVAGASAIPVARQNPFRFAEAKAKGSLDEDLVKKPAWWLPAPPEWGPFPSHLLGSFYGPDTIPMPVLPGSRAANALEEAMRLQAAPLHTPETLSPASTTAALLQLASMRRRNRAEGDPMQELSKDSRFRAAATGGESHDGKGNYKKLPDPLEKPEWWLPTPPEWGAPHMHSQGGFLGPAQVPSPVLPAAGGHMAPSLLPESMFAYLHRQQALASLMQRQAKPGVRL